MVLVALAGWASAGSAQGPQVPSVAIEPAGPSQAEIVARGRAVQDTAAVVERQIEGLARLDQIRRAIDESGVRQQELASIIAAMGSVEYARPERLLRVRDLALAHEQRLGQEVAAIGDRLDVLAASRAEWLGRLGVWSAWEQSAPDLPEIAPLLPEIVAARGRIEEVLAENDAAAAALTALHEEARTALASARRLVDEIEGVRAGRREALLRADQPILFTPAYLAGFGEVAAWRPTEELGLAAIPSFLREHAGLLLLHIALVLALALVARRIRPHARPEGGWSGVLHHPWAFGAFGATVLLNNRYLVAPPLWDVVTWSVLAASGAVLASMLARGRAVRLMIVSVAAVYPLVLLAEAIHLPTPIFRLGLAAAAAAATIGFPLLSLQSDPATPTGRQARVALRVTAALSAAVLLAQVIGFDQLSRWLVHAMLVSAYVVLTVVFLIVVTRGAIKTLLRVEFIGRARYVGSVGIPLAERVVRILNIVFVISGALALLDVWEVAPAPTVTWNRIVSAGFVVAGIEITVGRIIAAAFVVYLAGVASWLARTLVNEEVSRGWSLERGVTESINTLVHYAVITLGVLLGLGALGVQLQNFAIIAGALGVGIGFGLQNVVNNFVSGLILLFERPVRVGDTVEIDGEWGTIKKIGLRSTVVVTFTQAELIVPNADLVSQKVTNWSLTNPITRVAIPVGVAYGSDVQRVLEILVDTARTHPAVLEEPAPNALFMGFGDSSLDFELRIWIREIAARLVAKSAVMIEIDRRFREAGIEIPFPQRDLHIRSMDPSIAESVAAKDGE
jgi:potassium-dependent mechanosensitive channel